MWLGERLDCTGWDLMVSVGKKPRWWGVVLRDVSDSCAIFHSLAPSKSFSLPFPPSFSLLIPLSTCLLFISVFRHAIPLLLSSTYIPNSLPLSPITPLFPLNPVMIEDAQMAGNKTLNLPVRTAGDVPLTLKERVASVSPNCHLSTGWVLAAYVKIAIWEMRKKI